MWMKSTTAGVGRRTKSARRQSRKKRETTQGGDERIYRATQWQLMWWQFRKHKLALAGVVILLVLYGIAIAPGAVAPADANARFTGYESSPRTRRDCIVPSSTSSSGPSTR